MDFRVNQYVHDTRTGTYFVNADTGGTWRATYVREPVNDDERRAIESVGRSYVVEVLATAATLEDAKAACERRECANGEANAA